MKTQYNMPKKTKFEETGTKTRVARVKVVTLSQQVAQAQLAGLAAEASRLNYEFKPEDRLPEDIITQMPRNADPVDLLHHVHLVGQRMREAMAMPKEAKVEGRAEKGVVENSENAEQRAKEGEPEDSNGEAKR